LLILLPSNCTSASASGPRCKRAKEMAILLTYGHLRFILSIHPMIFFPTASIHVGHHNGECETRPETRLRRKDMVCSLATAIQRARYASCHGQVSQTRGASPWLPDSAPLLPFATCHWDRSDSGRLWSHPPSELVARMRKEFVGLVHPLLWIVDDSGSGVVES